MVQLSHGPLENSCFLLTLRKSILVHFRKHECTLLVYVLVPLSDRLQWSTTDLLKTSCAVKPFVFLKLFPLAEIPFSLYLLIEVIFIFQDPFHISPPLGNLPQFIQSNLSQPCVSRRHWAYHSIYHSASCIYIEFFTYYGSAYLSIRAGVGKLWSVGKSRPLSVCKWCLWEHRFGIL